MRNPVQQYLESIVEACRSSDGDVARYIPELASADPDRFALCLATVDGRVYEVGDSDLSFSIQSISKPFTYGLALSDRGREAVTEKVGVEPSGEAFNEISLAPDTGRPLNPMINAGAITTASLVDGEDGDARFERVLDWYRRFAGRDLSVDEAVYRSELDSAHRNRAIAHMLREFDVLDGDPEDVLAQYIRQCSIDVTTRDLALMGATLANGGVQPRTNEQVLGTADVEQVLSVLMTCGMYDAAGDWVSAVGMPAKSGVSGGIVGVLPGQVGIAVFSPRLDPHGNSVRGVTLFERMSHDMELHIMHVSRGSRTAVRSSYSLADVRTRRRRTRQEQDVLDEVHDRAHVYELHGDLLFAGAESVVRSITDDAPELVVVDFTHVNDIAEVSRQTLLSMRDRLREEGAEAVVVDPEGVIPDPEAGTDRATRRFHELAAAIEWAEGELIRRHGSDIDTANPVDEHPLLSQLSEPALATVRSAMTERSYAEGDVVLTSGGDFSGIHLITRGQAVAQDRGPDGSRIALVTMGPGTSFGELALGTDDVQETEIIATTDLELLVLTAQDIQSIGDEDPAVGLELWQAIARDGYRVADRALRRSAART